MDAAEVAFRFGRAIRQHAERLGVGRAAPKPPSGRAGAPWLRVLPRRFRVADYTAAAERILGGTFDVFSLRGLELGFPPAWNRDPKSGCVAPLRFGKAFDYRSGRPGGDVKYLWEINRHLELVTLAQAWHLTGEARYARACRTLLDAWFEQCPYPLGANWCASLELAIRLVNWSVAWFLLGSDESVLFEGSDGEAFRQRWLTSIFQHCHFIDGHLSRHSSANNHLLGEAVGLLVGSLTWPLWQASAGWRDRARAELEREALEQTFGDGVNREQATWYHHAVAEMMLVAGLIARANACELAPEYWRRAEAMLELIASIMDVGGEVPCFGDADDGVLIRLAPLGRAQLFRSLLATGAVLFGRADFAVKAGDFDDGTRWLLGDEAERRFAALRSAAGSVTLPVRRAFPQGGYYILGGGFETSREVRIVADAGPFGYLSIAAHAHADALSFTLSAAGKPVLVDPGTFAYHCERRWRDYFRSTAAHNTLRIDGLDQAVAAGSFLWLHHPRAWAEEFRTAGPSDRLVGRHDGYERLADPVQHRRTLEFDRERNLLTVTDQLLCRQTHEVEVFWHFAPECRVARRGTEVVAEREGVTLILSRDLQLECALHTGSSDPPYGWYSPAFDTKIPATTLVLSGRFRGSTALQTRLRIAFG